MSNVTVGIVISSFEIIVNVTVFPNFANVEFELSDDIVTVFNLGFNVSTLTVESFVNGNSIEPSLPSEIANG